MNAGRGLKPVKEQQGAKARQKPCPKILISRYLLLPYLSFAVIAFINQCNQSFGLIFCDMDDTPANMAFAARDAPPGIPNDATTLDNFSRIVFLKAGWAKNFSSFKAMLEAVASF